MTRGLNGPKNVYAFLRVWKVGVTRIFGCDQDLVMTLRAFQNQKKSPPPENRKDGEATKSSIAVLRKTA